MINKAKVNSLEEKKFELILMRIKNNYYRKDNVIEKVVEEIVNKEIDDLK